MCSGLRKIIEDASSLSHRLNISEPHSFITMNNIERLFGTCYPFMRKKLILISMKLRRKRLYLPITPLLFCRASHDESYRVAVQILLINHFYK